MPFTIELKVETAELKVETIELKVEVTRYCSLLINLCVDIVSCPRNKGHYWKNDNRNEISTTTTKKREGGEGKRDNRSEKGNKFKEGGGGSTMSRSIDKLCVNEKTSYLPRDIKHAYTRHINVQLSDQQTSTRASRDTITGTMK